MNGHRTLDAAPIIALVRGRGHIFSQDDPCRRSYSRAQQTGRVRPTTADELCVRVLHLHPAEVYGDDWWAA